MKVFAIGDLHLSGAVDKPMDIFGPAWEQHARRIEYAWRDLVSEEDIVLLPGDFSWAMHLEEAQVDFAFLHALPGAKVMIRGNHDYWWNSVSKVRAVLPPSIRVVQNDSISFGGVHIAGTRGWTCPGSAGFEQDDQKIYDREVGRLAMSLAKLSAAVGPAGGRRIAMLHYPPFNESRAPSGFTEKLEAAGVETLLYGHLHGKSCRGAFEGERNGISYHLVSADHIGFAPKLILEA